MVYVEKDSSSFENFSFKSIPINCFSKELFFMLYNLLIDAITGLIADAHSYKT